MTRQEDRKICAASGGVDIQWNPASKYGDARVMRTPEKFRLSRHIFSKIDPLNTDTS